MLEWETVGGEVSVDLDQLAGVGAVGHLAVLLGCGGR